MQRITISLPDEVAAAVKREARRHGQSVSAIARDALGSHLHLVTDPVAERELSFIALGSSGQADTAERIEELMTEEWTPERLAYGDTSDRDR
jgi:plasmid stability protein